jgi:phage gp37-like protein
MIKLVEDAMIARLRKAIGDQSETPAVKTVASLPAQLDDAELERRIRTAPGCYVAFLGGHVRAAQPPIVDASWAVYVITQSDNEADRRRGSKAQAGAYVIVLLVIAVLHMSRIAGVGTLLAGEVNNLFAEKLDELGVALYAITFTIPISVPASAAPADLAAFVTAHADWLIAPHVPAADQKIPLPAPGQAGGADITDTDTLPQGDD